MAPGQNLLHPISHSAVCIPCPFDQIPKQISFKLYLNNSASKQLTYRRLKFIHALQICIAENIPTIQNLHTEMTPTACIKCVTLYLKIFTLSIVSCFQVFGYMLCDIVRLSQFERGGQGCLLFSHQWEYQCILPVFFQDTLNSSYLTPSSCGTLCSFIFSPGCTAFDIANRGYLFIDKASMLPKQLHFCGDGKYILSIQKNNSEGLKYELLGRLEMQ